MASAWLKGHFTSIFETDASCSVLDSYFVRSLPPSTPQIDISCIYFQYNLEVKTIIAIDLFKIYFEDIFEILFSLEIC